MWNTLHARPTFSQGLYWWRRPHLSLSPPSSHLLRQDVLSLRTGGTFSNSRTSSQFTATLTTILLTRDVRRGDPHSNGLWRFSLFRNVAASTWLRLWLHSRLSKWCAEVVLATLPNVSISSINLGVVDLECTHVALFDSDIPCPRVAPPAVFINTWAPAPSL